MAELAWLIPVLALRLIPFHFALPVRSVPGQGDRVGIAAVGVAFILSAAVFSEVVGGATAAGRVLWATSASRPADGLPAWIRSRRRCWSWSP